MKKIATIDLKDYDIYYHIQLRKASRAIIIKDKMLLMIYSNINGDYKLPGGGKKIFESSKDTLLREVKEETGYSVLKNSIKEFGYVEEIRKSSKRPNTLFKMISEYFLCQVKDVPTNQNLERYEKELQYVPVFVNPYDALRVNLKLDNSKYPWINRENVILRKICNMLEEDLDESSSLL